jgi:hypothetical protein
MQREPRCSVPTDRQTERQTNKTKLVVAFRDSAKAPTNKIITTVSDYEAKEYVSKSAKYRSNHKA